MAPNGPRIGIPDSQATEPSASPVISRRRFLGATAVRAMLLATGGSSALVGAAAPSAGPG